MTLPGLLQPSSPGSPSQGPILPDIDRTEWAWGKGGGGGGWKGNKGNPNAALSALTLLAFLFFLNILQSCLKDSMNQNPGVVVMMMPTPPTAAGAIRVKRESRPEPRARSKGEYYNHEWDDYKITELVHSHVESYWSNKEPEPSRSGQQKHEQTYKYIPLKPLKDRTESLQAEREGLQKKRISTKLQVFRNAQKEEEEKYVPDITTSDDKLFHGAQSEEKLRVKEKPLIKAGTNWRKILTTALQMSKPLVRTLLCCDAIVCETSQNSQGNSSNMAVWSLLLWVCRGQSQGSCVDNQTSLRDCKNPFVRNLLRNQAMSPSNVENTE